jgi:glycosidase
VTNYSDSSGDVPALRPSQADHALHAIVEDYPRQATASSFALVDSHDTNRVLFVLTEPGDSLNVAKEKLRVAALLQFTWVGAPMIYYGDEVSINAPGKNGFGDPYNRAPYPWTDESGNVATYGPPDTSMLAYYTRLAELRRTLPSLRAGSFQTLLTGDTTKAQGDEQVYAFARAAAPAKPVIVALNKSANSEIATISARGLYPNGAVLVDQLLGIEASVTGGSIRATVPGHGGLVLVSR